MTVGRDEPGPLQPDLIGITLADRYRLRRMIGSGAMGAVYEAQHAVIGRRLAVKVLHQRLSRPSIRERFFHEARAAAGISHEHVVQVVDFGLLEGLGLPYLVMEYVDGETLEARIERESRLPVGDAVELACQLLSALEVLHGAGMVHRDIKPANIILARVRRGRVFAKLVDFGVARACNPDWKRPELTRVDQLLGTPAYLSPEQASGGRPDPRWDTWAVATILFEMLSGQLPFAVRSVDQVVADIAAGRLIPLHRLRPDLPGWLLEVMARAHHQSREERFASATAFLQALEQRAAPSTEGEARTTPFVRVDLVTPPPELVDALKRRRSSQLPEPPDALDAVTTPHRRSDKRGLSAVGEPAADREVRRTLTDPRTAGVRDAEAEAASGIRWRWLPVAIAAVVLAAFAAVVLALAC